jgi:hypothetical protein
LTTLAFAFAFASGNPDVTVLVQKTGRSGRWCRMNASAPSSRRQKRPIAVAPALSSFDASIRGVDGFTTPTAQQGSWVSGAGQDLLYDNATANDKQRSGG